MGKTINLISSTENLVDVISTAARMCYSSLPLEKLLSRYSSEDNERLVRKVAGMGHLSVIEHGVFTFEVPERFRDDIFNILIEKPFLKVTELEDRFIVSLNLRTMVELKSCMGELELVKELSAYIPDFLSDVNVY